MLYFDVNPPVVNTVIDTFNLINVCGKSKTEKIETHPTHYPLKGKMM